MFTDHIGQNGLARADVTACQDAGARFTAVPLRVEGLSTIPVRTFAIRVVVKCGYGFTRIWEPAAGRISALMRTDSPLKECAWIPSPLRLLVALKIAV